MQTRFIDGLGRTISRDPNILDLLLTNYKSSNHPVFAQAGKEIEALNEAIIRLNAEIDSLKKKNQISPKASELNASKGPAVKSIVAKTKV